MGRGGLFLALLVGLVAALLFVPYLLKASDDLRRHATERHRFAAADNLKSLFHARSIAMKEQQRAV